MSVIKASLKGHRFERSLRRILSTSELSPSFPATLASHPGSLSALMQHGILKQAVYIKRSAGGGHHAEYVAEDKEGIQTTTTLKHKHTHAYTRLSLLFCFFSCFHTGRCIAHMSMWAPIHTHTHVSLKKYTRSPNTCSNTKEKHRLAFKRLVKPKNLTRPELTCKFPTGTKLDFRRSPKEADVWIKSVSSQADPGCTKKTKCTTTSFTNQLSFNEFYNEIGHIDAVTRLNI